MDPASTEPIFPRLASGPRKMEAEEVARNQRGRLQGAMVEAVARHGFPDTTLRELVSLAGVSKSTFYEHFESKQDCFLSTFDDIVLEVGNRADRAFKQPGDLREKMQAGIGALLAVVGEEEAAAALITVESLTLGAVAVPHTERASERLEGLIQRCFDDSPSPQPVSALTVRGIIAGIRNCAYRHLRAGKGGELPGVSDQIVEWILRYERPPGENAVMGAAAAGRAPRATAARPGPVREPKSKRERIISAATRLGYEKGYEALSIPAISAAAGVSNQTFYDHFPGKQEAFLAGFDLLAEEALHVVAAAAAAESERPEAVGAGLRALLDHAAEDELFARMAFFELPMAGPAALDQADRTLGGFTAFFKPPEEPEEEMAFTPEPVPPVILEAIGGGTWAIIQHEIAEGRREQLPELAPQIAAFAMTPFG